MSFPKFPQFQKITVADKDTYLEYYSALSEPYSYFSIADLLIWVDFYGDLEVSDLNNNVVIKFTNVLEAATKCYSLIGTSRLRNTLEALSEYLHTQTDKPQLSFVPEQMINLIHKVNFPGLTIEVNRDDSDYVYKIDDFVLMDGKPYRNIRERVRNFNRDNDDIRMRKFNLRRSEDRQIIQEHVAKWSETNQSHNDPDKFEVSIIDRHLNIAKHLSVHAYGLYVKDTLASVVIFNEPPQKDWIIVNHVKCDYSYAGVFGAATYEVAVIAKAKGYKWINFQQDLGLEGLRRIKLFMRPEKFLRCYTISFDGDTRAQ